MRIRLFAVAYIALTAASAAAKVEESQSSGFVVSATVIVAGPPGKVYTSLAQIGRWWSGAHSYSGDAANMSLDPRAGGCFCERLADGGSIEHMRVVAARPGKVLRLRGALGPLQAEGVDGALDWALTPQGGGTRVDLTYVVGGYMRGGPDRWAGPVDTVLTEQLARLARFIEHGMPAAR